MAETYFSREQVQELLDRQQKMFEGLADKLTKLNPLDQRKLDEALENERRRALAIVEFGKIEEESERRKKNSCSHMRYPAGHRLSGHSCPKGTLGGEWTTGGQAYQNGTAMVICNRCSSVWMFRPSPEIYTVIVQNGLMGEAPPREEDTICIGCFEMKPVCKCRQIANAFKAEAAVA